MASPASVPNRINAGKTTAFDLSLKVWSGEILAEWDKAVKLMDKHEVRSLPAGAESVQFPAHGNVTATYHTIGDNVITDADDAAADYLKTVNQGEILIYPDREVVIPMLLSKVEERIAAPDWRSAYARKMGTSLAQFAEQNVFRTLYQAASTASGAIYTGSPAGGGVTTLALDTGAKVLTALLTLQEQMDTANVPEEGRFAAMPPSVYMLLISDTSVRDYIDSDYNPMMVNGQLSESRIFRVAGFELVKTNNIPGASLGTINQLIPGSKGNDYNVAMTNVQLVCWQREAVGTLKAMDISLEVDRIPEYRGDLVQASYVMGHGKLRPEAAAIYKSA